MDLGLNGKIAMVCAGSKGLGRACAVELAREGANISLCARHVDGIAAASEAIVAVNGTGALGVVADVSVPDDLDAFLDETVREFGRGPDIIVWNGGGPRPGKLLDMTAEDLQAGVQQHLHGAMHLISKTVPGMVDRGFGRVIGITSVAVRSPIDGLAISNTVRSGLTAMFKTLAAEVGNSGVTVNTVQPGYTLTDRLRQLAEARQVAVEDFGDHTPAKRLGNPDEFAAAVAFLASTRASYINGVSLPVDGGLSRGLQ